MFLSAITVFVDKEGAMDDSRGSSNFTVCLRTESDMGHLGS